MIDTDSTRVRSVCENLPARCSFIHSPTGDTTRYHAGRGAQTGGL